MAAAVAVLLILVAGPIGVILVRHEGATPASPSVSNAARRAAASRDAAYLVNSLPMAAPQDPSRCAADSLGGSTTADFNDAAGHLLERLDMDIDGCAINTIFAPDGTWALLSSVDGGPDANLATKLRSVLGLDWSWA